MKKNLEKGKANYSKDPILNRILNRMPTHVASSFTDLQLEAIRQVVIQPQKHSVNLRYSIPFISQRFYLVILAGPERRSLQRRRLEANSYRMGTFGNLIFLATMTTSLVLSIYGLFNLFSGPVILTNQLEPEMLNQSHPTALPWITSEADCFGPQRHWEDGLCFDQDHSRHFRR